jgi:MFS family permease
LGLTVEAAREKHQLAQAVAAQGMVSPNSGTAVLPPPVEVAGVASLDSFSPGLPGVLLLVGIMFFVAAFALGNGVVCWVLISEIFPNRVRGRAVSLATQSLWATCFLVSLTFPSMLKHLGITMTFWIYAGLGLANSLYVLLAVPETRRRSLEEIEASWTRKEHVQTG